jgi:predicted dehydrogenase
MTTGSGRPLHVGLIGYGLAGMVFHAPLINSIDDFVLDTIVTADPERQARAGARYPGVRTVPTAEELWSHSAHLDLVVVAAPNRWHVPLATAALNAGLAVVVDKPMTATAAEAASLADLADEKGVMLSVFQNRRWDSDFLTLRHLVGTGELGRIWRFESRYERWRPTPAQRWRESGDPADVGGLLYDLGSHLVDQALVLFGPVSQVYAEVVVRRPGARIDDDAFVALEHTNGVRSHLWMNVVAAQGGPRLRVLGSQATFEKYGLDVQEAALAQGSVPGPGWGAEPEGSWGILTTGGPAGGGPAGAVAGAVAAGETTKRPVPSVPGDYPAYYVGIAAALRGSAPPPVAAREAVATMAVLEAALSSAPPWAYGPLARCRRLNPVPPAEPGAAG